MLRAPRLVFEFEWSPRLLFSNGELGAIIDPYQLDADEDDNLTDIPDLSGNDTITTVSSPLTYKFKAIDPSAATGSLSIDLNISNATLAVANATGITLETNQSIGVWQPEGELYGAVAVNRSLSAQETIYLSHWLEIRIKTLRYKNMVGGYYLTMSGNGFYVYDK